jgi:hypothetical protein
MPAVAVAAVLIAVGVLASVYAGSATTVTRTATVSKTVTATYPAVRPGVGECLEEVPSGAGIESFQNSTFDGYSVTYPNGTEGFFSLNSCPVPVTTEEYQVYSMIEADPRFVSAENGSTYFANPLQDFAPALGNSTGQYALIEFNLYGNEKFYPCGPNMWVYKELGAIQAVIPLSSTEGLQLSGTEIQVVLRGGPPSSFHC